MTGRLIAIVRVPGLDAYGASTTHRVYQRPDGFEVETSRDYYNRDGNRDDYEFSSVRFADERAALASVGISDAKAVAA